MSYIKKILNNRKIIPLILALFTVFTLLSVGSFVLPFLTLLSVQETTAIVNNNNKISPEIKHKNSPEKIVIQKRAMQERIIQQRFRQKQLALSPQKAQLRQAEVLAKHLLLAEQYAAENKFELAYLEKKTYIKKYQLYSKEKRRNMIATLTKTYDVDEKNALNELLKSKNKLNLLRVVAIKEEQEEQAEYFIWIIAVAFVFLLLLFKQLKVRQTLIKLARIDVLTGLANRHALFEHGQKLIEKRIAQPFDLSVLLLDLDYFKRINDNYGHQVGDQVLITVSVLINETMRSRDVLARLGGEEFAALLPFADENKAKAIAMRINEKIAQYDFSSLGIKNQITLSVGVASMQKEGSSFDDILHDADLAMYQAKESGRNKVISYQSITTTQERRGI